MKEEKKKNKLKFNIVLNDIKTNEKIKKKTIFKNKILKKKELNNSSYDFKNNQLLEKSNYIFSIIHKFIKKYF